MSSIEFVDTTTRDGNQSLWSATGLTTPDVLAIAPTMNRVGYHALDFTSSTHMAVSVRFHHEDPWERIRLVSAAMPATPLGMITTGMRFISWTPANPDVMALSLRLVVRNGLRRLQIADPSNDPVSPAIRSSIDRFTRQAPSRNPNVSATSIPLILPPPRPVLYSCRAGRPGLRHHCRPVSTEDLARV